MDKFETAMKFGLFNCSLVFDRWAAVTIGPPIDVQSGKESARGTNQQKLNALKAESQWGKQKSAIQKRNWRANCAQR